MTSARGEYLRGLNATVEYVDRHNTGCNGVVGEHDAEREVVRRIQDTADILGALIGTLIDMHDKEAIGLHRSAGEDLRSGTEYFRREFVGNSAANEPGMVTGILQMLNRRIGDHDDAGRGERALGQAYRQLQADTAAFFANRLGVEGNTTEDPDNPSIMRQIDSQDILYEGMAASAQPLRQAINDLRSSV